MLTHIHLRNFALVETLEVDFQAGLTVLTGETGAGKSILMEALGLALGNRADSAMVRHGSRRAEIDVSLDVSTVAAARQWLRAHELDSDEECLLRRTIGADGRSRAYINGRPVPRQMLQELGGLLVDIHGQHEHQSLLRRDFQLQLLDAYAEHVQLRQAVAASYRTLLDLEKEQEELNRLADQEGGHLELLRYQLEELQALNLSRDALQTLEEEHRRLASAGELMVTAGQCLAELESGEHAIGNALARTLSTLQALHATDPRLAPISELLDSALIQIREAAVELRHYGDGLALDPSRLEEIERRLGEIHDLARKHRVAASELPEVARTLAEKCTRLEKADDRRQTLSEAIDKAQRHYLEAATALSESRRRAAVALADEVSTHMAELGMPAGRLDIQLKPLEMKRRSARGLDQVEFLVAANPGHPPRPLAKVASGGELSRISLAIHVVTAQRGGTPTLVFDEVDVGVSGRVAEIVGQKLRALGEARQVLCITHLPQVAAQGRQHLQVSKSSDGGQSNTFIRPLEGKERREEIARMLGGVKITARTRAHAQEMIEGVAAGD